MPDLELFVQEDFCYLTTTGRVSGRPHTIEIWFAISDQRLYLLSGGRDKSDWVKNILHNPSVSVRINDLAFSGTAHLANDATEDTLTRRLLFEKYTPRDSDDLTSWSQTSLPVVIDPAS